MGHIFRTYLLPGLVFQGVIIGGGYATGRELVEFFMATGPLGGLLGMAVSAAIWGAVMAVSFELCRLTRSYDYRHFFTRLLGRAWFLYEILFLMTLTVSLAVIGAATGEIVHDSFGLPPVLGTLMLLLLVGLLVFRGNRAIERFMGFWSFLLYATYLFLFAWCLSTHSGAIADSLAAPSTGEGAWFWNGVRYAGYNIAAVPAVFFCLRHLQRRREALLAGVAGGLIAIVPAALLFIALLVAYPAILAESVPTAALLDYLELPWFNAVFQVVLIGTFIQTGVGLVHTVNERVASTLADSGRELPVVMRPLLALALLLFALLLAEKVGIVNLIARGYGLLTWGFIAVFVVPVLTVGLRTVMRSGGERDAAPRDATAER